jgi:hypothetical protein
VKKIQLPLTSIQKIASFMERVPEMLAAIEAAPSAPSFNRKEAEARTADLIKYAGLDANRQGEFTNFIMTPEGAMKTIASLTSKVASLQAEVSQAKNLAVGGPSSVSSKSAGFGSSNSSNAWCEALLG